MKINSFVILGSKYTEINSLELFIKNIINERYFFIYNKDNLFFYPETFLEYEILKKYKRVKNIDFSYSFKDFGKKIIIKIEEKIPSYLFCIKNSNCFFVEENGYIFNKFDKNKTKKNKEDFTVFEDLIVNNINNKDLILNNVKESHTIVFNKKYFNKVKKLINDFEKSNLFIKKVLRNKDGNFVFYTKSKKRILIKYNQDFLKIPFVLKILSQKKVFKIDKFNKDFLSDIVYIDLTYNDYIYYCQKGSLCQNNYNY